MPMYEYVCARCSKEFEEIVSNAAATPACPNCKETDQVEKVPLSRVRKSKEFRPPFIKTNRPPGR